MTAQSTTLHDKWCGWCGIYFQSPHRSRKYCCESHNKMASAYRCGRRVEGPPRPVEIPDSTIGLIGTDAEGDLFTQAACRGVDDQHILFFPAGYGKQFRKQITHSKTVCGECPVRAACLEYALANEISDGTWGGLTEWERRGMTLGDSQMALVLDQAS